MAVPEGGPGDFARGLEIFFLEYWILLEITMKKKKKKNNIRGT
jgi:hypothetical protein